MSNTFVARKVKYYETEKWFYASFGRIAAVKRIAKQRTILEMFEGFDVVLSFYLAVNYIVVPNNIYK